MTDPLPGGGASRARGSLSGSGRSDIRGAGLLARLEVAPAVAEALAAGHGVVALESTLITHGLPHPANLEVALAAEAAVRRAGAIPATIAVGAGRLRVGLADAELEALASAPDPAKVARPALAAALLDGGWGGTTVSATMLIAAAAGIRVFATGGIGGVHRGALAAAATAPGRTQGEPPGASPRGVGSSADDAGPTFDISSDLDELARTPMIVVCAGPKAILDVPATLEYLETRGVPVVAVGTDELPGFWSVSAGIPAPASVPSMEAAIALARTHLDLALGGALLLCVPVPGEHAVPADTAAEAVEQAIREALAERVHGPAATPWLLARVATLTGGRSVRANRALIEHNAHVAAQVAVGLAERRTPAG